MLAKLLSYLYALIIKKRNAFFENNPKKTIKCKIPVISIGNISVGGTGKTPFVISLGKILKENEIKFAVVGRGYKRKSKGEIIVRNEKKILADSKTAGDEMLLIAESLQVPVIANEKKYSAAQSAEKLFDIDCILVDDGFQHRKLHRDLDIVIIDNDTIKENNLIPAGRLREPFKSIQRADIIVLKDINDKYIEKISDMIQNKLTIRCETKFGEPYNLIRKKIINNFQDDDFLSISGIAKPQRFISLLNNFKINLKKSIFFDDHHNYLLKDISKTIKICKELSINKIATTEKDAVKLIEFGNIFADNNIECFVFPISIHIESGKDKLIEATKNLI